MTTSDERLRLFFAAWPSGEAAAALHAWALAAGETADGRVTRGENVHLTLAFLGAVAPQRLPRALSAARRVAAANARADEALALPIEAARYWPRSRVLWVGPKQTPAALAKLAGDLRRALAEAGFELQRRAFAAHVTLIRKTRLPRALPPLPEVAWPIDELTLVRSMPHRDGSRYDVLERFAL